MPSKPGTKCAAVALTIAGSDSGGGAGIQADLKTFAALGVFGTCALTCVTAQNPDGVAGVVPLPGRFVGLQIRTVCGGFPVAAAKTGMLFSAALIRSVAGALRRHAIPVLVVDPVMVATSGARLLREDAVHELCRTLLPMATVLTPNVPEAEALWGRSIGTVRDLRSAARELGRRFGASCVVKGGHLPGKLVTDVLYHRGRVREYALARVGAHETHGTGCTFSAALTAFLARGMALEDATREAGRFVALALKRAVPAGSHWPLEIRA